MRCTYMYIFLVPNYGTCCGRGHWIFRVLASRRVYVVYSSFITLFMFFSSPRFMLHCAMLCPR
jgi:hypothetical protein